MKLTNNIREAFIRATMDDVPCVDYDEQIRKTATAAALAKLPPAVVRLWKDPKTGAYVGETVIRAHGVGVTIPGSYATRKADGAEAAAVAACAELAPRAAAQKEQLERLRQKLKAAAYSVTTRKALADLLPEFAKYLPADEQAALRTVPVVTNLVADFAKAGWPKGAKPKEAHA